MPTSTRSPTARARTSGRVQVDPPRRTLSPESWIEAATEVLVDHDIGDVRIDVLATRLGVTRGSFYWHFRDRDDLLQRLLMAWSERTTRQLTERLASAHSDPRQQIRDLISLPFRGRAATRGARIELAIRAWARRDEAAKRAVDASDRRRLDYHEQLFVALGFPMPHAKQSAFILYGYEVAESMLHGQGAPGNKKDRAALIEQLILSSIKTR
jgi:AcrR family transcriptional regulator